MQVQGRSRCRCRGRGGARSAEGTPDMRHTESKYDGIGDGHDIGVPQSLVHLEAATFGVAKHMIDVSSIVWHGYDLRHDVASHVSQKAPRVEPGAFLCVNQTKSTSSFYSQ